MMPTNRNKTGKQAILFLKIVHSRCSVLWSAMAKCGLVTKTCRRQRDGVGRYGWGTPRGSSRLSSLRYRGAKVNWGYALRRSDWSESTGRKQRAARRGWSTVTKDRAVCLREAHRTAEKYMRYMRHQYLGAVNQSPKRAPAPPTHTPGAPMLSLSRESSQHHNSKSIARGTRKNILKGRKYSQTHNLSPDKGLTHRLCEEKRRGFQRAAHTPVSGVRPGTAVHTPLLLGLQLSGAVEELLRSSDP